MGSGPVLNGYRDHDQAKVPSRVVLKFGGTSIGKFAPGIGKICLSSSREYPIAVVCSARSGRTKAEGTTSLLLKAAREASEWGSQNHVSIIDGILKDHIEACRIISPKIATSLIRDLTDECENVKSLLSRLAGQNSLSHESEDAVMSVGEKLSARHLTALLQDNGLASEYVDLSNVIDFDPPKSISQPFFGKVAHAVGQRVLACGDKVPVITGYFGQVPGGLLKVCGRGYSDLLAALVAVGVGARELQVWKEVSGVYTADPNKVPTATLLPSIHWSESNELTFYGSEVIHHLTVQQCTGLPKIPIRIKNVKEPNGSGTIIAVDGSSDNKPHPDTNPRRPTAVTCKESITVVNVHSNRKVGSPEFLAKICTTLDRYALQVDLFELNEMHVSLAMHSKARFVKGQNLKDQAGVASQHRDLTLCIQELEDYGEVEVFHDMAIISLIGKDLKQSVGIAGRFLTALGKNNINIEMISQGASEINISCVIAGRQALRAINVVHTELFTFLD